MPCESKGRWDSIAGDGVASATTVAAAEGSVSGPSIDSNAEPRSLCVLCIWQRAESAGFRCIGHEPWSAPCAHVHTRSDAALPVATRRMVVPVTTDTCRKQPSARDRNDEATNR